MSDILELVESTPESRIAEEVKAMVTAYDQAVAECERLRTRLEVREDGGPDGIECRDETIRALERENEALRQDAERYRIVKTKVSYGCDLGGVMKWSLKPIPGGCGCFDAAIDALHGEGW